MRAPVTVEADEKLLAAPELRASDAARTLWPQGVWCSEPALAECHMGQWRGMALKQLPQQALAEWLAAPEAAPHGGESLQQQRLRVGQWLEAMRDDGRKITAVTHASVMRAAIAHALDIEIAAAGRIDIEPLAVVTLYWRGRWRYRLTSEQG